MAIQVSKSQFKAKALEYFRQVENSGEPLLITGHGQATLELRPHKALTRHPLDILRGSVRHYDHPLAPIAEEDWEAAR